MNRHVANAKIPQEAIGALARTFAPEIFPPNTECTINKDGENYYVRGVLSSHRSVTLEDMERIADNLDTKAIAVQQHEGKTLVIASGVKPLTLAGMIKWG